MLIPKMIHSIKSMSASTLVSSSALPSAVANSIEPTVRRAAPVPWHLWMSASAVSCIVVGGYWDISWHMSIGRDTFWTPAHLAVQLGGVLAAVSGGFLILAATFGRGANLRDASIRVWGFRGPLGAFISAWGGVTMATSAPFDNWWHNAYGLDVKILSPPHMVLYLGILAVATGGLLLILACMNRTPEGERRPVPWIFFLVGAETFVLAMIAIFERTFRTNLHNADSYRAMAVVVPIFLLAIAGASRHPWGATITAALYSSILLAGLWIMPLFPAEPKLGPVYQHVTHFIPLEFPLLIVAPAVAVDLLRRRLEGQSWWLQAPVLGSVLLAILFAAQWPFASFLLSPAARNWFFGTHYRAYFMRPSWFIVEPEAASAFATGMAEALLASAISAGVGLLLGDALRRIRR